MSRLRLPFELIPTPCLGRNLHTLLPPAEWDRLRRQVYMRAGYRCQVCGRRDEPLHAHEVWRYDDRRHVQRLVGLRCLCACCHFCVGETGWPTFALGFIRLPLSGRRMAHAEFVAQWCQQNECDEATWRREARAAYADWMRRSQHEDWTTDYGRWAGLVGRHTSGSAIRQQAPHGAHSTTRARAGSAAHLDGEDTGAGRKSPHRAAGRRAAADGGAGALARIATQLVQDRDGHRGASRQAATPEGPPGKESTPLGAGGGRGRWAACQEL